MLKFSSSPPATDKALGAAVLTGTENGNGTASLGQTLHEVLFLLLLVLLLLFLLLLSVCCCCVQPNPLSLSSDL